MAESLEALAQRGFGYALSLAHDESIASDLLQDAWAGVIRARGPLTRPYLFRTIRNRWIDQFRRQQRVAFEPLDEPMADPATERSVDRLALDRALATLRPEEREVLYLCVVEGYTAAEAAALVNKPRNTVLSLVRRGKQKVRDWYATHTDREALP